VTVPGGGVLDGPNSAFAEQPPRAKARIATERNPNNLVRIRIGNIEFTLKPLAEHQFVKCASLEFFIKKLRRNRILRKAK
jgi:hypothetical protein